MRHDPVNIAKLIRSAIKRGDTLEALDLIGTDKSILEMMTPFGTWLHVAAAAGNLELTKRLVDLGIDINRKGGILGGNALGEAASDGRLEIAEFLISCGGKMDIEEPNHNPLFGAIYGGHTEMARLLIDKGIDISVRYNGPNMKDMDALAFAIEWGRSDIASLIREKFQEAHDPSGSVSAHG